MIDRKELWNLDATIAEFVLPRLREFKEVANGYPCNDFDSMEEWKKCIQSMIVAFEWTLSKDMFYQEKPDHVKDGFMLFAKYFHALWI